MNPNLIHTLNYYGWNFAGVSQPDHRRIWAKVETNNKGQFVRIERIAYEDDLVELLNGLNG